MYASSIILLCLSFYHPFYVSVCELHFNTKSRSLEVTHRIFYDDFVLRLNALSDKEIILSIKNEDAKKTVFSYVSSNFSVEVNGKPVQPNFIGYELEEDVILIYAEIEKVPELKRVEVVNTILMDYTEQQTNIIHLSFNNKTKSRHVTAKNPRCKYLNFEEW